MRQLLKSGAIVVDYVESTKNLATPFTKGLPQKMISKTTKEMGLMSTIDQSLFDGNPTYVLNWINMVQRVLTSQISDYVRH